jgi:hypothetical protein
MMDARIKSGHDEKSPSPNANKMCGMIAYQAIIFRREPYPLQKGRVRTWNWPRRVPARSRVPANRHDPEKWKPVFRRDHAQL